MYDHVLVGTDGSPRATLAVDAAAKLAHAHQARLTIAHAYRWGRVVRVPTDPDRPPLLLTARAAADAVVTAAVARAQAVACGGLVTDTLAMPGHPTAVMLTITQWITPDVVVIGDVDPAKQLGRRSLRKALERQDLADLIVIPTSDRTRRSTRRAA
jgi:nucleotide-binding universal stress UspA family protein